MFDIGFWELMILGVVALLVVGPERLPKLAYTAGKWLGKGRSMLGAVKSEIDREIKAEELRQVLDKQKQQLNPFEEVVEETSSTLRELSRETKTAAPTNPQRQDSKESPHPVGDAAKVSSPQPHDDEPRTGR